NALNYVQPDHLGTPRTVIDPVRDVAIWKWDIKGEAFGNSPPDQDPDRDGTAFVFGMRFPGQRYDGATGLNQNYFRDYDTSSGRYGQSDPVGLGGGLNTYAYSESSPLSNSDPYGLTIVVPPWWSISSPKPALTPRPITAPLDPAIPVPGTSPNDPSGEYCQSLARRIENTKKEIYEKRYPDLGKDPNPLPWRIGPGEKLKETIRGHEKLLNRRLRELRQLEDEYDQKCRIVACT
ncbi:RHS repeat-associated core domain-containing protein, partial [Xanthomonas graminis]|uniref:RHS repeat-associated core domain-containing protein n=2 Tax=Xanthomonas graminis TaxID=3390026 RepID=UPI000AEDAE95